MSEGTVVGLSLRVLGPEAEGNIVMTSPRLVIAGYTGRDEASVAAHIEELAASGVPPPPRVPFFYELDPGLVTTASVIYAGVEATSGEVEPVLLRYRGSYYLGVGSDHTDRDLERTDIAAAKAACPKPLGSTVLSLAKGVGAVDWDTIVVGAEVDGRPYQYGTLATLRTPEDLLQRVADELGESDGDLILYGGTVPLLGGHFVMGTHWRIFLRVTPETVLTHTYDVRQKRTHERQS